MPGNPTGWPNGPPRWRAPERRRTDRCVALSTIGAVADAVKSGQAAGGMVPATDAHGMAIETTKLLLDAFDPDVRVVGQTRIDGTSGNAASFWMIARNLTRMPDLHPDRLVVNIDAPGGSKAFSLVVAGLSKLGFTVTGGGICARCPENPSDIATCSS